MRNRRYAQLWLVLALLAPLLAACGGTEAAVQPTATEPQEVQADTPAPVATGAPTRIPTTSPESPAAPTEPPPPTEPPMPEPSPTPAARFEGTACPFVLPPGMEEGEDVECGYLLVPEDRADPASRTIRLAVGIFHNPDGDPAPDPIIYLEGGPGGSALEMIDLTFDDPYAQVFAAGRDLILFDQRGVGLSEPALDCPEVTALWIELLDEEIDNKRLTDEEIAGLELDALLACRQDLSEFADPSDYHSAANAADVNDLRLALGYDKVNLWSVSYGTHLALDVMRDFPEGLRSVVLDSPVPPDANSYVEGAPNADRALRELFDGCAADAACADAYPDLEAVLWETVDALNESPASIEVVNPLTGETYDALLDGDSLTGLMIHFLYQTSMLPRLPQIIYAANGGDYFWVARLVGLLLATQELISDGMHYSVKCHDEAPFASLEEHLAVLEEYPRLAPVFLYSNIGEQGFRVCEGWDAGRAPPIEDEPVFSELPTLVMSGEYDPVSPPATGERVASTLPNSFAYTYPGVGHGASTVAGCPQDMMIDFFLDPTVRPDDDCLDEMDWPRFELPGTGKVELVPFESEIMGIRGQVPAEWEEIIIGVYQRARSDVDPTVLLAQALPIDVEELAAIVLEPLGLDELPEPAAEREANGIRWTLYEMTAYGLPLDLGLAQSDGLAMLVLLQCEPQERDALYEAVFLPVIDAMVPTG